MTEQFISADIDRLMAQKVIFHDIDLLMIEKDYFR
jgi:hypothetical protein